MLIVSRKGYLSGAEGVSADDRPVQLVASARAGHRVSARHGAEPICLKPRRWPRAGR